MLRILLTLVAGTAWAQPATPTLGAAYCAKPAAEDARPYTLCLAETAFEIADEELNRQWAASVREVRKNQGRKAARRLHHEQRAWIRFRVHHCEELWASSPVSQISRNTLDCMTQLTHERLAKLRAPADPQ